MSNTDREVKYKISADADGGEKIKKLADEIVSLVKTGGDAAPTFKKFSDELDKLANKNQLITEFGELKNKTLEVKAALNEVASSVEKSASAMRERTKDVAAATEAERQSREAVDRSNTAIREAQVGLRQAKAEVAAYKAEVAKSGDITEEQQIGLQKANVELKRYASELANAKSGLDKVVPAQIENANSLKMAQVELSKATQEFNKNKNASSELKTQYDQTGAALQVVRDKMSEAGVNVAKLSTEYVNVNQSVKRLGEALQEEKAALEKSAAAERAAAEATRLADAAYKEKVATLRAQSQVATEVINLERTQNQVALESARATLAAAKAKGEERVASEALVNVKKLEGQQTLLQAKLLQQESVAEEQLVNAKRDHLSATNRMTDAIETEIGAERLAIESKRNLADATQKAGTSQIELSGQVTKTGGAMSSLIGYAKSAVAPIAALVATVAGLTEFARVNVELENVGRTLRVVTGTTAGAKREMEFVKETSNRLGLELISTAKAYAQFAAATKGSSLEGAQTRLIFESVARAMSVAGRSAAETEGALNALGQMVSKGVVQMEELRGQLGDRLPGAMKVAADSSGVTTAQLIKMIESGQVLAEDLLPKLAVGLNTTFKEPADAVETLTQKWYRFRNALSETFESIGSSGVLTGLLAITNGITTITVSFGALVNVLAQGLGASLAAAVLSLRDFGQFLNPWGITIDEFLDRWRENWGSAGRVVEDAMESGAQAITRFTRLLPFMDEGSKKIVDANKKIVEVTKESSIESNIATKNWLGLTAAYVQLEKHIADAIIATEKGVEARKAEIDIATKLAALRGDEVETLRLNVAAANEMQKASENLSAKRESELSVLGKQLDAMKQYIEVNKDESKEHKKAIEELEKKIAVRKEEYERAVAQAKSSQLVTDAAKAEQRAHADNSGQIVALRQEYQNLIQSVNALRVQKAEGVDVTVKLTEAERQLAIASRMYRDAVDDQTRAIKGALSVKQAEADIAQLTIKVALEAAKADYDVAKAKGDETAARRASNEMRRLEIELAKIQAQMLKAEAEATLEMVKVKRMEAEARGDTSKQTELEIKMMELSAQAKQKQSQIQEQVADRLRRMTEATDSSTNSIRENNRAASEASGSMGNLSSSYDRAASSADRLAMSQSKVSSTAPKEVTSGSGWSTKSEFGEGGGGPDGAIWDMLYDHERGRKTSFTDEERAATATQLEAAKTNLEIYQKSTSRGGMNSYDLEGARSAEKMYRLSLSLYNAANGVGMNGVTSNQGSGPAGGLRTFTVNVNMGGKTTKINTASENDAQALTTLFGQLGSDKSRAN